MELLDSELMFNTTSEFEEWTTTFSKSWNDLYEMSAEFTKANNERTLFASLDESNAALAECIELVRKANFKYFMKGPVCMFNGVVIEAKNYHADSLDALNQLDPATTVFYGVTYYFDYYGIRYGKINEQV